MRDKYGLPKDFSPHRRIEHEYGTLIDKILKRYLGDLANETPANVLRAFANLSKNTAVLESLGANIAKRMVTQVRVANARSWRSAARAGSRGREIYDALQRELYTGVGRRVNELVEENARLISSIPQDVRVIVNREIAEKQFEGLRPEEIADFLRARLPVLTRNKARLIARTETGKAATALTRARSENLGINWYQWATSEDERVRASHRLMDKILVEWNDAPAPEALAGIKSNLGHYHAGNAPNCRCDAYPMVTLDAISWPARVYSNGAIVRMKRSEFAELSGKRRAVA